MTFEKKVIDKILNTIKKHQGYLTRSENLPQLAKLGYMFTVLWYYGRACWGMNGIIKKSKNYDCESNPNDKIDMCEPLTNMAAMYIYDAWAMHLAENMHPSWAKFSSTVLSGAILSDLDKKKLKLNKTYNDWFEIFMDEDYEYSGLYMNEQDVMRTLFCSCGNEYGYVDGYIVKEAGAGNDEANYGDWQNAKFSKEIQKVIDKIMSFPEVELTVNRAYENWKNWQDKKDAEDLERNMNCFGMSYDDWMKAKKKEKHPYHPFNYIDGNIKLFDKNTHPSYIKAAVRMCKLILKHEKAEKPENIKFAKKFIKKFSKGK